MHPTKIQLLAHATFKVITPEGKVIIVDPWFTGNDFLHEKDRVQEKIDLILVTHGHEDHFDKNLPDIAQKTGAKIVANSICRFYLLEQGVPLNAIEPMNLGGTIDLLDVKVSMVNAFHVSHISLTDDKIGYPHQAVGFIVQLSDGIKIYFAGDTSVFGDMKLIGEIYKPDIAVLPIGDRYTMGPLEASYAVRLLGVKHVIPSHYGTFPSLVGKPETLSDLTNDIKDLKIHVLKAGQTLDCSTL
ncbi:MAG: metal-dependent hydrolase [Saprospiraceae bacterium]|nr:metal-dependent hydrolase [Saprospiraceae bacterium]